MRGDAMTTFGDLRSILHSAPSAETWAHLCAALDAAPKDAEFARTLLPYAKDSLERWPDRLRQAPWPWLVQALTQGPPPAWSLVRHVYYEPHEPLHNAWGVRIPHSDLLAQVTSLSLRHSLLTGERLGGVLRAPLMGQLKYLDISHNFIRDGGLRGLTRNEPLSGLRTLILGHNAIQAAGVKFIKDAPWWPTLKTLKLPHNHLTPTALTYLADALKTGELKHLDLRANTHGVKQGLEELVHAQGMRTMRSLNLSKNGLDDDAIALIADAPFDNLERLILEDNLITLRGMRLIATSETMPKLRKLHVTGNPGICEREFERLREPDAFGALELIA